MTGEPVALVPTLRQRDARWLKPAREAKSFRQPGGGRTSRAPRALVPAAEFEDRSLRGASLASRVASRYCGVGTTGPRILLTAAMRPERLKKDSNFYFARVLMRKVVRVHRGPTGRGVEPLPLVITTSPPAQPAGLQKPATVERLDHIGCLRNQPCSKSVH